MSIAELLGLGARDAVGVAPSRALAARRGGADAARHMTEEEMRHVQGNVSAENFMTLLNQLPTAREMARVAEAGAAKRGWYMQSAKALVDVFGPDAPRFTGLLAALSPQTSVESNFMNTMRVWEAWDAAGRPTDKAAVRSIIEGNVQQNAATAARGEASALEAWTINATRALTAADASPRAMGLSGPKVDSFYRNLVGITHEVTNDTWLARYAGIDPSQIGGKTVPNSADDLSAGIKVKSPAYIAMNVRAREAAQRLSDATGEAWTPAEVQETVWSWSKSLSEASGQSRVSAPDFLLRNGLPDSIVGATVDFGGLFHQPEYSSALARMQLPLPETQTRVIDPGANASADIMARRSLVPRGDLITAAGRLEPRSSRYRNVRDSITQGITDFRNARGLAPALAVGVGGAALLGNGEDAEAARLWHGSKHEWTGKSFRAPAVNSGVGTQRQGWGGYVSEDRTFARGHGSHLYEFDVPDHVLSGMLEWNLPLQNQPPKVARTLKQLQDEYPDIFHDATTAYGGDGQGLYDAVVARMGGDPKKASQFLDDNNIPGVSYSSRTTRTGDGSPVQNYVFFDPEYRMRAISKDGVPVPALLGGVAAGAGALGALGGGEDARASDLGPFAGIGLPRTVPRAAPNGSIGAPSGDDHPSLWASAGDAAMQFGRGLNEMIAPEAGMGSPIPNVLDLVRTAGFGLAGMTTGGIAGLAEVGRTRSAGSAAGAVEHVANATTDALMDATGGAPMGSTQDIFGGLAGMLAPFGRAYDMTVDSMRDALNYAVPGAGDVIAPVAGAAGLTAASVVGPAEVKAGIRGARSALRPSIAGTLAGDPLHPMQGAAPARLQPSYDDSYMPPESPLLAPSVVAARSPTISWEAAPGSTTDHLLGFNDAPRSAREEFHNAVSDALRTDSGGDVFTEAFLPGAGGPGARAPGWYEGRSDPAEQLSVDLRGREFTPDVADALNAAAAARGIVTRQNAMAWNRPRWSATDNPESSGVYLDYGRRLTEDDMLTLGRAIDDPSVALVADAGGVRALNFGDTPNPEFQQKLRSLSLEGSAHPQRAFSFDADLGYMEPKWGAEGTGAVGYLEAVSPAHRARVKELVDQFDARVREIEQQFSEKYGWRVNPEMMRNPFEGIHLSEPEPRGALAPRR